MRASSFTTSFSVLFQASAGGALDAHDELAGVGRGKEGEAEERGEQQTGGEDSGEQCEGRDGTGNGTVDGPLVDVLEALEASVEPGVKAIAKALFRIRRMSGNGLYETRAEQRDHRQATA